MIKKIALPVLLLFSLFTKSQENNSLLWKISGNGLEKDSYLYGTMHVSQKIAFHLDDVFYQSLLKSDFVALESDPSLWLDNMFESNELFKNFRSLNSRGNNFYTNSFKPFLPKPEELMFFISREDMLMNGILYRTNNFMQDFQEDTYLDMFIFQAGKKFGKKIFSLEDLKRSNSLVEKAQTNSRKPKPDLWLQKKLKKENYFSLLSNSYRDRNVQFIDSLNQGMYTKNYLENMLYLRNQEMADNIDSIAKKGSLFSAIGAAHLAGNKGVINMLKEKGYTVTPLTSSQTEKGKSLKNKIEAKNLNITYKTDTSSDRFFSAKLPNKLYELNMMGNTIYLSPDLANGSYVVISRINTYSLLNNDYNLKKNFNKLLYESIPGKIISKKEIERNGIKGLDIINKTKSGDYQRYYLFFTPLEILIFKMTGKGEFVKNFGNEFFNSIQLKNTDFNFEFVSPKLKGFSIQMPNNYIFTNNNNIGNRQIQAYDKNDDYYFLKEVILNDINYLEEDKFELERIQNRFYKELELESDTGIYNKNSNHNSYESKGKYKKIEKYLHLKTVTKGGHYFLLGKVSKDENKPTKFFNSFKINAFKYNIDNFKIQKDTSLYFSVKTTIKPPVSRRYNNYRNRKKKAYEAFNKSKSYKSKTNEEILVELKKKHDLTSYKNLDSLAKKIIKSEKDVLKTTNIISYEGSRFQQLNKLTQKSRIYFTELTTGNDENNFKYVSYKIKDSLSSKVIKVKNVISNGLIYELKTLIDTTYATSKFVDDFYKTFKPKDTVIGTSLFTSKTNKFLKLLKDKDSIVLDGYYYMSFYKSDSDKLIDVIKNYQFEENQLKIKKYLIKELSKNRSEKVDNFFKELYKNSYDNPQNQIIVFNYFSKQKTKKAYNTLLELLELDIPLSTNSFEINNMFDNLNKSLSLSKNLFPDLLNYAAINEYKKPIYNLLSVLVEKEIMKPKVYKSYKKQILNEAKIELKRQLSKKENQENGRNYYNSSRNNSPKKNLLNSFVKIVYPFKSDKNNTEFLEKLKRAKNMDANTTYLTLQIKNGDRFDKELFLSCVENLNSKGLLYQKLKEINKEKMFPKEYLSKEKIYKSFLFKSSNSQVLKDSIVFLKVKKIELSNKNYEVYFFKSKAEKQNNTYRKAKEWKLNIIIFENKGDEISVDPVYIKKNLPIDETKPIEEILDIHIEQVLLSNRKRVDLSSNNYRIRF